MSIAAVGDALETTIGGARRGFVTMIPNVVGSCFPGTQPLGTAAACELRKAHGVADTGEHFWVRSAYPPSLRTDQVAYLHIDIHGAGLPVIRGAMMPTPPGRPARLRRSSFLLPSLMG